MHGSTEAPPLQKSGPALRRGRSYLSGLSGDAVPREGRGKPLENVFAKTRPQKQSPLPSFLRRAKLGSAAGPTKHRVPSPLAWPATVRVELPFSRRDDLIVQQGPTAK